YARRRSAISLARHVSWPVVPKMGAGDPRDHQGCSRLSDREVGPVTEARSVETDAAYLVRNRPRPSQTWDQVATSLYDADHKRRRPRRMSQMGDRTGRQGRYLPRCLGVCQTPNEMSERDMPRAAVAANQRVATLRAGQIHP